MKRSQMIVKKDRECGFSLLELAIAMLIIAILVAVVILLASGFFSQARETSLKTDLRVVKSAVDTYMIDSLSAPTADGKLPLPGKDAPIDFNASFTVEGQTLSFYPDFLSKLPRHHDEHDEHDEEVWRIDSKGRVSVAMDPEEY